MSYIVIPVYSFACDYDPPEGEKGCSHLFECSPANSAGRSLLDEAHRQLRAEGWAVRGQGEARRHFCSRHLDEPEEDG